MYALVRTVNACTDTDSDGLGDLLDIDDDNDGILDTVEQTNCITSGIAINTLTFSGSAITASTATGVSSAGGDTWKTSYSHQNLKLPISLSYKFNSTTESAMFGLFPVTGTQNAATWADGGYKFYPQTTSVYGYFTTAWDFGPISITSNDILSIDISATGYVTAKVNGIVRKAFQGVVSDYKLNMSSYRAANFADVVLTDANNLVTALVNQQPFIREKYFTRFKYFDSLLLKILEETPQHGKKIFQNLFHHISINIIFFSNSITLFCNFIISSLLTVVI